MSQQTKSEEMAASVGQDKTDKEVVTVYDRQHGTYQDPVPPLTGGSHPGSTVQPFGGLRRY